MTQQIEPGTLIAKAREARDRGASTVEIVGRWVWAQFNGKPDEATRAGMSAAGFRWSKSKRRWYFAGCQSLSRRGHSWTEIKRRHASVRLEELERGTLEIAA